MQLFFFKLLSGKEDPDQTAPEEQSDLGLHCLPMSFYCQHSAQNFTKFTYTCG